MPHPKPITILVADDDADDRMMIEEALKENRLANDLRFVKDGEELMSYLERRGEYRDAEMCVPEPGTKVLDAGAGPGKFCLIGSLVTEGEFFGIEQRRTLVDTAREIAERYKISRVHFDCGNVIDFDWNPFDSIYLYNPFSENLDRSICIDDSCELFPELYI